MASLAANAEVHLAWYARLLVRVATFLKVWFLIRVPHRWIIAVTNRSWFMRIGSGPWKRITIDNAGRIINCARD